MEHDWPRILAAHGPAVWRVLRSLTGNDADARDCYQTVFLEVLTFSRRQPVDDWDRLLNRIARSRALDVLRKRYRAGARIDAAADPASAASRLPAPEQQAEAAELAERLRASLALLPPQQAEVFVMRFVEQLSYEEIAARTGSSPGAVGALLNRARAQLRRHLEEDTSTSVEARRQRHDR
jgi:RNA polymerase sigma-70 factor (ECF subfamily)